MHTYIRVIWNKESLLNQDIDRQLSSAYLKILSELYGMENYESLTEAIRWIRNDDEREFQEPNILNICVKGRKRRKLGQQYCPECLKEQCYFKTCWRLSVYPMCLKHKCLLLNSCPHCNESIDPMKIDPLLKDIGYCWSCWRNLRINRTNFNVDIPSLLMSIDKGIKTGWFKFEEIEMYAYLFMTGFWRAVYSFYGIRSQKKQLWERLCRYFKIPFKPLEYHRPYNNFKDEQPITRLNIVTLVECLLKNWPIEFIKVSESVGMSLSNIDPAKKGLPFWLDKVARTELNKGWYRVNTDEIQSCLEHMKKHNIKITRMGLARELGLDESKKLNPEERQLFDLFK